MKKILISAYCLMLAVSAQAVSTGPTDDAMTVGGGARPIGMGRAFLAISDDCDAQFINPAGLASLKGPQAMSMFTNLIQDVYYMEYSGAVPTPYGTVGAGYITTGVTGIPESGGGTSDYYDSLLAFSYSTSIGRFAQYGKNVFVGLNFKIFNRGFTGVTNQFGTGYGADLGLKMIVNPNLSFAFCRQNILPVSMGGGIKYGTGVEEYMAGLYKVGAAIRPAPLPKLTTAIDLDLPAMTGRPPTGHLGFEWKENKYLSVRAGMDQSVDAASESLAAWNPTFGASLTYGGFRVDYAYHPYYNYPELANTYVSFSYIGEPWFAMKGTVE